MDRDFEGLLIADNHAHPCNRRRVLTIGDLPDDDLLTIFDFYVALNVYRYFIGVGAFDHDTKRDIESWQSLVHVCRRWRGLVFTSPRRLKLQLCCTPKTPAREIVDVWPALPLSFQGDVYETSVDNVIAVLGHSDRLCQIKLNCHATSQIEKIKIWTALQMPFPKLKSLYLSFGLRGEPFVPVLPASSLLGGSAPRLENLSLAAIPFPLLPKHLSATHLVDLYLLYIPHSGYISPEAMVTYLTMLTSLDTLHLRFESAQSCPDQESRRSPPPSRSILPALREFLFRGVNEYLEDLVARIDTPRLHQLSAILFNDVDFDTPELTQFISCTPSLGAYDEVHLVFHNHEAKVMLRSLSGARVVEIKILCRVSDWQLSSLAQICTLPLHFLLTMENLYIYGGPHSPSNGKGDIENTEWLDLLLPFTAVKNLYLCKQSAPRIAPTLQELTGGRTDVLPILQNLFLEEFPPSEPVHECIAQFISARNLTNRPVTMSIWDWEGDPRSYRFGL